MTKVKCPYCGYEMPIRLKEDAECEGVMVVCKGRQCRRVFEVVVRKGKQIVIK